MKRKRVRAVSKTKLIAALKPHGRQWKSRMCYRNFAAASSLLLSIEFQFGNMRLKRPPSEWRRRMNSQCGCYSFSRLSPCRGERTKVRGSEPAALTLLNDPHPHPPPLPYERRGDPDARSNFVESATQAGNSQH